MARRPALIEGPSRRGPGQSRRNGGSPRRPFRSVSSSEQLSSWVNDAERLVLAALPRRLNELEIAGRLNVRVPVLCGAFLTVKGQRMYRAITTLRLKAARRLLNAEPGLDPVEVAKRCGFPSRGRFIRDYLRQFGERPGVGGGR